MGPRLLRWLGKSTWTLGSTTVEINRLRDADSMLGALQPSSVLHDSYIAG